MPLRQVVFASYASQTYTAIIGIALIPLYLRYLGAEAFGLVGVLRGNSGFAGWACLTRA